MKTSDFRAGDRVRSDDPWLKIDRPCTVTVARDGKILSLRPDGLTRDVPVPFDRRIAFVRTDEPVPGIAPDAMDRWHVLNEAFNQRSPEEIAASFITTISQDGKPWLRMVSQSWDAMAVVLSIKPIERDWVMFFKCDVRDWYKRFAGGTSELDFHHWVAWNVDHRPYGVSTAVYFADRAVAAPSDPTEPYPVVRTRNTIDPACPRRVGRT